MSDNPAIHRAAEIIKKGGIIAFPTETVYGLGADAFNPLAVARIFEVKKRPHFDPLIVHVAHYDDLERLVIEISSNAIKLMERFWPGPLTVVLLKKVDVPDIVTSGLPTIAVRMPRHPMTLSLIGLSGSPIVGPSANPFGYVSPTTAATFGTNWAIKLISSSMEDRVRWAWSPRSSLLLKESPGY
jgi:L-threonylcarbamoyladenylate synthase